MKHLFFFCFALLILTSCSSQQSDAVKQAKEVQSAIEQNRPGTIPATDGGWTMTAKLNGKAWKASSLMPPEAASRIIGYYKDEYIGLPYDSRDMVVGHKEVFGENNAVDLSTSDEIGMWGGRKGEMEITKVSNGLAEGTFHFTATASGTDKTVEVTDGFFRIKIK